jgi:hypothetical protein
MKRLFLLSVSLLIICIGANAQLLSIGVKGGMNFSTLTNSKTIPVYRSNGSISLVKGTSSYHKVFTIGGLLALKVPLIGIQAEILYSNYEKHLRVVPITKNFATEFFSSHCS